ncbi:CGNR zinc finger domain-containing protein [Streptomyces sp. ID38640]|uniref:CGNR zinc finger domain-containing protein n=1 Tax=Streptomyces sp. ID38640 TaxID=1265399 RepID=UPI0037D9C0E7
MPRCARFAFLRWEGGARLGRCLRAECARAYVDTSRNGRRRYCSARCGNTEAVMRHRSRQPGGKRQRPFP